jgi:TatD DNase family protein
MKFTDSHCHLDDTAFSEILPALLEQCLQVGVHRIIVPSIAPKNFDHVLNLSKNHQNINTAKSVSIFPCLGIHPWFLENLTEYHLKQLALKVEQHKSQIIAIGEIGLDGAIAKNAAQYGQTSEQNYNQQMYFFDYQLNLAQQHDLPVIIHHRQSHDKIIPFLKKFQLARTGIIHGFSGSYQQAKAYLDLGFKLGVGGTITYSRAKKTINTIKRLPLNSLVLETDAPSMPLSKEVLTSLELSTGVNTHLPPPTNSPVNIKYVFAVLNQLRAESAEQIAHQLEENIEQLFFQHSLL